MGPDMTSSRKSPNPRWVGNMIYYQNKPNKTIYVILPGFPRVSHGLLPPLHFPYFTFSSLLRHINDFIRSSKTHGYYCSTELYEIIFKECSFA